MALERQREIARGLLQQLALGTELIRRDRPSSAASAVLRMRASPALASPAFAASAWLPASSATAAPERIKPDWPRKKRRAAIGSVICRNDMAVLL
jgi:hypothetical protein